MVKRLLSKKYAKWVIIGIVVFIAVLATYSAFSGKTQVSANTVYSAVTRDTIENVVSGSGVVEPIERYDITPLAKGNVLEAPFEEGDTVKKDDILYRIDDQDIRLNIEKMKNSIEKTRISNSNNDENIAKLTVKAPASGKVTGLSAREGDNVSGKLCELINNQELKVKVPFSGAQIRSISAGSDVTLVSADYMSTFSGRVTYVSNSPSAGTTGGIFYDVEITASNPGAIPQGTKVVAVVHTADGDVESPMEGTIEYQDTISVMAESSGKVGKIHVKEGQYVTKGTVIATLENESLVNTRDRGNLDLRDAQISLESEEKKLDNYNIKCPIDGTVLTKSYKTGDTIDNTSGSVVLMTVVDMSKMVFEIDVDELDIAKIKAGQEVTVTSDALAGQTFEGIITNVAGEGASSNGVTTFKVKVTIDNPEGLRPGMNVDAKIVTEKRENVLTVPIAAVIRARNASYVFVKENGKTDDMDKSGVTSSSVQGTVEPVREGDGGASRPNREGSQDAAEADSGQRRFARQGDSDNMRPSDGSSTARPVREGASDTARPVREDAGSGERPVGENAAGSTERPARDGANGARAAGAAANNGGIPESVLKMAPAGTRVVVIEVGINDDSKIEVLAGLSEGDEVALPTVATSASGGQNANMMGGGMMGGGMMGGAPGMSSGGARVVTYSSSGGSATRSSSGGGNRSSSGSGNRSSIGG